MPESSDELLALIQNLQEAQRRIVDATGGKVDAVLVTPSGPVLLPAAQQQLLRNEAEYRQFAAEKAAILDALPAHIALLDPEGRILTVNRAWRDFAATNGFSGKDFAVGLDYPAICEGPREADARLGHVIGHNVRSILKGITRSFSTEYSCEELGAQRWFRILGSPMPRGSGYGAVVMHVDIDERKHAEARTEEVKQRLETLVDEATIGILVHEGWKVIMANDATARIFGYTGKDEILALPDMRALYSPEELLRITAYDALRLAGGPAPSQYQVKARKRDGKSVTLENHAFAVDWGDRKVVCIMITDVTEHLSNESQIRQLQKMEAVGQLTGGIAHDFNNILMVIFSNADELLEQVDLDPKMRRRIEQISEVAQRAAELTHSLLAFSRKLPLKPKHIDLNELVMNTGEMLRRTLGAQIEIESLLAEDLWPVNVDAAQLESVLVNLCINARDAMPSGGRLLIETANVELDAGSDPQGMTHALGPYVRLTVTDTGSGIAPEALGRVFEPFFTTKDVGKGTGLGLSMVYGFLKQSGGHVEVYSELGVGTSIKVHLPRVLMGEAHEAIAKPAIPHGTERILVVEDDAKVREVVVGQLMSLGYAVDWAVDGATGLVAIEATSRPYDLMLTDVVMPGPLSGKDLADAVMRWRPETNVLFMSGYSEDVIVHGGRLDPGVHLLTKPFRKADLARAVRERLDARANTRRRAAPNLEANL
jgi:PAS domain S-box-containing protein